MINILSLSLVVDQLTELVFLHINISTGVKNRNPLETATEIFMVYYKIIQVQRKLFMIWPSVHCTFIMSGQEHSV